MIGNLLLSIGTDILRTFGCSDLSGAKGFNISLGTISEQIQCQLGQPTTMITNNGFMVNNGSTHIIRFGSSPLDLRIQAYEDILMNNNFIGNLRDPNSLQDAATKIMLIIQITSEYSKQEIQ